MVDDHRLGVQCVPQVFEIATAVLGQHEQHARGDVFAHATTQVRMGKEILARTG
jgi:hypothetical protein